jgi:hypothetical protein
LSLSFSWFLLLKLMIHEWWWRSFLCVGSSSGLFIYAYCLYYYYAFTDMSGFTQTSFFFVYMAFKCLWFLDARIC